MDSTLIKKASDKAADTYDGRFARLQNPKMVAMFALLPPLPLAPILDLGCGTGLLMDFMGERLGGREVIGIDLSRPMLRHALRRGESVVQANMDHLPFKSGAFGTIFAFTSIIDRREETFPVRESVRVLCDGGVLVMTFLLRDIRGFEVRVLKSCGLRILHMLECGQDVGFVCQKVATPKPQGGALV